MQIECFDKNFILFSFTVKIDLVEVVYYLKLFQTDIHLLSKQYDKSVAPVEPLLFLNIIDIGTFHFLHQHQFLLVRLVP